MTDTILNYPTALAVIIFLSFFGIAAKLFGASFQRIAKWYCYTAVFSVVVIMDSIAFPSIGGKDWFFRFTVELSLLFTLLWWAYEARSGEVEALIKSLFKKPLVMAASAFTAAFLLACAFAYDPRAAFWSNYGRGEGGFQIIHYYLFFLLLVLLVRETKDWKRLFNLSLIAGALVIFYGVLANWGAEGFIGAYAGGAPVPSGLWHQLVDGRFEGTLGNPAYVAAYLIFSIFYAAYLWCQKKIEGSATALTAWGYGATIAALFFFLILTQTRGALIGLGAGIFVFLAYLFFSSNKTLRKWSATALVFLVLAIGLGFAVRNSSLVKNIPAGRLLQINTSDLSVQTRFWVWGEAWQGFLARPIVGWGPENFSVVFDAYFNPKFYVPGQNNETWFDRAHSVFFDYLSETGILGLLSYLAIFVAFYWEFFRKHASEENKGSKNSPGARASKGLLLALPVAYLVQGSVTFEVLPMYINLFLFLAFACWYFGRLAQTDKKIKQSFEHHGVPPNAKQGIAVILGIGIIVIAIYGSYMPMRKTQIFMSVTHGLQTNPVHSLDDLESRVSVPLDYPSPIGQTEVVRNFANNVQVSVADNQEPIVGDLITFLSRYYGPILSEGRGLSFGQDLNLYAAINKLAFTTTGDPGYLAAAKQYYLEGNLDGPNRPQPLYGLFDVYRLLNDKPDAIKIGNEILANWPTDQTIQEELAELKGLTAPSGKKQAP